MKEFLKKIFAIDVICPIIITVFLFFVFKSCINTYGKSYEWPYYITVTYQFENDTVVYKKELKDVISYNRSVTNVDPMYVSTAGWKNELIVIRRERSDREFVIINYTPKKVMVQDITWYCTGREEK
jgi:hypothetical protein